MNQVVITLVGVWLTRFLLARLGAHEYGLWLVTLQIFGYLLLADLGVVALLPREVSYALGRRDVEGEERVSQITGHTVRLVLWQMPLVAVVSLAIWIWIPDSWASLRDPLAQVLIAFVAFFPLRVLPALLQGLQDLAFAGWAQLAAWGVTTATSVLLVLTGEGLSALASSWILGQIVLSVMCWIRLHVRHPGVLPVALPPVSLSTARGYLAKSSWVSISQVSQVLMAGSDVLVVGALLGPAAVVPYVCTSKLVTVIRNQPLIFLQSAVPGLSQMRNSESRERILQATTALMQGTLILSGAAACLILPLNEWFVGWWVGSSNYGGFILTVALLANMVVRHTSTTIVYSVYAFGYERRMAVVGFADGVMTISGALTLVHFIGAVGAPLASIGSACLVCIPPLLRVYAESTGVPRKFVLRPIWPWFKRFVPVMILVLMVIRFRPPSAAVGIAVLTVATMIAYGLFQVPLLRRPPLSHYVPSRIARMLARLVWSKQTAAQS